jgi:MYXO-CTERM domain-containing protein
MGFQCVMQSATAGVCFFAESAGCCSVDRSDRGWLPQLGIAAIVLGLVLRRRRR